ncbi:glycosyltransferase family 90 protein [Mixia osmundae IAM 14324]|uniref:Glycosyl transferase CAP10 domain-containing protein n=1 Tax=Mixia osmundae (strain CBS 9802 / IAM 14324 / JCM 22182 / KY 12970) TaxID=764103 RepID=G7E5M9_MIXOS|nr:glycosyltransferase family 90 protein [Mixia osmundae IAM 14324]KEI40712.1 glycosyltransferase family 90 protein [Mixia osmundae IAM 14324]GAA98139.1 hypothetical protein E5Q_04822 [Mixia osmundae IAM 14324]
MAVRDASKSPSRKEWRSFALTGSLALIVMLVVMLSGSKVLQNHLVLTDVDAEHPILTKLKRADTAWAEKLARQSRTLSQAKAEYRRRYHRLPPPGYDQWYEYAKKRGVVLIDEYDNIMRDLEPYWQLPPAVLRQRTLEAVEEVPFLHLLEFKNHSAYSGPSKATRAYHFSRLIEPFRKQLPDFSMAINNIAEPRVLVPWKEQQDLANGIMDETPLKERFPSQTWTGDGSVWSAYVASCPPETAVRKTLVKVRADMVTTPRHTVIARNHTTKRTGKRLISPPPRDTVLRGTTNKTAAGSLTITQSLVSPSFTFEDETAVSKETLCNNPRKKDTIGLFYSDWRTLQGLYPIFSVSKIDGFADISIPSHYYVGARRAGYTFDPSPELDGKNANPLNWPRKIPQLFWRGSTTGGGNNPPRHQHYFTRHRFLSISSPKESVKSQELIYPIASGSNPILHREIYPRYQLNRRVMNASFTSLSGCGDAVVCNETMQEYSFAKPTPLADMQNYKFILDLDGLAYSARFLGLLAMGTVTLKSTVYDEFWSELLVPWKHYVPVSQDFAEIYNILAFFDSPSLTGRPVTAGARRQWPLVNFLPASIALSSCLAHPEQFSASNYNSTSQFSNSLAGWTSCGKLFLSDVRGHPRLPPGEAAAIRIATAAQDWKRDFGAKEHMEVWGARLALEWARLWNRDFEDF